MFPFLETDTREPKKYKMKTQVSVDNTVNDLRYEICVKDKNNFFIKRSIAFLSFFIALLFLETYLFKILKNLITSAFFLRRQILKNIDMP